MMKYKNGAFLFLSGLYATRSKAMAIAAAPNADTIKATGNGNASSVKAKIPCTHQA